MQIQTRIVASLAALAVLAIPFVGSPYVTDLLFRTCLLSIIAVSWNMMAGAGLISLGHAAFWGVGAYTATLVANGLGLNVGFSLLCSTIMGSILGAVLALVTGRLKGIYFAIGTLALAEGLRVLALMLPDFTGGAQGQYMDAKLAPPMVYVCVVGSLGALIAVLVSWMISTSRYQYALRAMRANEGAAQMLGIRPLSYRVLIVTLSAGMASFAGAASMWYSGYLDPAIAFALQTTLIAQIAPILGGLYTLSGPILGTLFTTALGESTRLWLAGNVGMTQLVYGLALVLCVMYLPQGFRGAIMDWTAKRCRRKANAMRRVEAISGDAK
ncbi:hypothetical protein BZM26_00765 [Paraburkholderia strydomiana]|nr:hypothetical protein BZM26_00765 [Paraburkholderia strydomiana]